MDWRALPLDPRLTARCLENGFAQPTPIQSASIPLLLKNRDVVAEACTGSGKTLAYVLPACQLVLGVERGRGWGCLVIVPTRELAVQVRDVFVPYCEAVELKSMLLVGGKRANEEISDAAVDIVIGTPGRLAAVCGDTHQRAQPLLKTLELLILDEADTLLGEGFSKEMSVILPRLPKQRRTALFSATQTKQVKEMLHAGLRNPAVVAVQVGSASGKQQATSSSTPLKLSNYYLELKAEEKMHALLSFISTRPNQKFIVFFPTCASVDFFDSLIRDGLRRLNSSHPVASLHGQKSDAVRGKAFQGFKSGETGGVLLCTDVAARGIDLPDVDWILQLDAPKHPDFFVHRVGRTARAGRLGSSLLFVLPNETPYVNYLTDTLRVPITPYARTEEELGLAAASSATLARFKEMTMKDRDLLEKGTTAFVSYIAHYSQHRLTYLFRLSDVDWPSLAREFVLLRIPKLKEFTKMPKVLNKLKSEFQEESLQVVREIPFKDAEREAKRQTLLLQGPAFNEQRRVEALKKNKQVFLEKRLAEKQEAARKANFDPSGNLKKVAVKRKRVGVRTVQEREMNEWLEDERAYKKFKKGKISEEDYDEALFHGGEGAR